MKLRAIALIAFLFVLTVAANAQATRADLPAPDNFLGIATFPLWDGDAPGALGKEQADVPTITLFRPWPANSNGTAVIIAPGGGYMGLAANHEGRQVADWFTSRGVTAFVLKYRLGQKYLYPIPLTDAQRAIRLVRARAKEFGIVPDRIGMMGFSAGGHLTAATGTMFDAGKADAADAADHRGGIMIEQSCCGFQKTIRSFGSFDVSFPPSLEAFFEFEQIDWNRRFH